MKSHYTIVHGFLLLLISSSSLLYLRIYRKVPFLFIILLHLLEINKLLNLLLGFSIFSKQIHTHTHITLGAISIGLLGKLFQRSSPIEQGNGYNATLKPETDKFHYISRD